MILHLKLVFVSLIALVGHPFYVSITEINHNADAKRIEVSSRIFYDDLEEVLRAEGFVKPDLINPKDRQAIDSALNAYFQRNLSLKADNKPVTLAFLGYEIEEDVAWCHLEAPKIARVKTLSLENKLLFGQFPKQSNIVHTTINGKRKSVKLDNPKSGAEFSF